MSRQGPCCTMRPWHHHIRNEDWTVPHASPNQMQQQNRVLLKFSHEQSAAMTWKKNNSFWCRFFKHGLVNKFIHMVPWFRLLPMEFLKEATENHIMGLIRQNWPEMAQMKLQRAQANLHLKIRVFYVNFKGSRVSFSGNTNPTNRHTYKCFGLESESSCAGKI